MGADGRTAYKRAKGRRWKRPMVNFVEQVWFRPLRSYTAGQSDLAPQLQLGRYVGTHGRNGDVLIITPEGVWKGGRIKESSSGAVLGHDGLRQAERSPVESEA